MDLLITHPIKGRFWEGIIIEEIIRGLKATGRGLITIIIEPAAGPRSI